MVAAKKIKRPYVDQNEGNGSGFSETLLAFLTGILKPGGIISRSVFPAILF